MVLINPCCSSGYIDIRLLDIQSFFFINIVDMTQDTCHTFIFNFYFHVLFYFTSLFEFS